MRETQDAGNSMTLNGKGFGRKIMVCYKDGETIIGYTNGISPGRVGFFLYPSDLDANTEKVFVIQSATEEVTFV
jgi:hypothetical protein